MSRTRFRVNPHSTYSTYSTICLNVNNSVSEKDAISEVYLSATGLAPTIIYFINKHSTIWSNWANDCAEFWVVICMVLLTVCSYHFTQAFQSESTLYICLNVKKILPQNSRDIWSLIDCIESQTHNHLLHKRSLNHLAKLTKWFTWDVSSYMYGAFECIFL